MYVFYFFDNWPLQGQPWATNEEAASLAHCSYCKPCNEVWSRSNTERTRGFESGTFDSD